MLKGGNMGLLRIFVRYHNSWLITGLVVTEAVFQNTYETIYYGRGVAAGMLFL